MRRAGYDGVVSGSATERSQAAIRMLSQHNRRTLVDIEEHLRANDPELARKLERFDAWAPPVRHGPNPRLLVGLVGLGVGAVLLAVALAVGNADALVLAVMALLVDASWWLAWAAVARVRSRSRSSRVPRSNRSR